MNNRRQAEAMAAKYERKYGYKAGALGDSEYKLDVIPTGSLALDYALGIGGWPRGHPVEVFGAPDIGKSSTLGYAALRNAQQMGQFCVLIALEPGFDPEWATKNGVDPTQLAIGRPNNGEEAFSMLRDAVSDGAEYILFDSIGAVLREAETKEDAGPAAMGQSALITWGVKNVLMPVWKKNVGLMFINQQRDDPKAKMQGVYESPGGWAIRHSAAIRIHLKATGPPFSAKIDGEDMEIGRTLVGVIKRNKLSEGTKRRAEFDWYGKATDEHPIGIDWTKDVINTAKRVGVIQGSGFLKHPLFPGDNHHLHGMPATQTFLNDHPDVTQRIRAEVLQKMLEVQGTVKNIKPNLEVLDGAARE